MKYGSSSHQQFLLNNSVIDELYNTKHCTDSLVKEALEIIMNKNNYPVMVVCSSGIHLTGTVIGCMRKLQDWSLTSIFTEYECFAGNNSRHINQQFIEMFDTDLVTLPTPQSCNLPQWFVEHKEMMKQEEQEYEEMMKHLRLLSKKTKHTGAPIVDTTTTADHLRHHRTGSVIVAQHAEGSRNLRSHSPSKRGLTPSSQDNIHDLGDMAAHHEIKSEVQTSGVPLEALEETPVYKYSFQKYLMDKHCPLISNKSTYSASSIIEDEDD